MIKSTHRTALLGTDILARTGGHLSAGETPDFTITNITIDSRKCTEGSLFVAMPGSTTDGHDFVVTAARNGACAALVTRRSDDPELASMACVQIVVDDSLQALGDLAMMARITHQQAGGRLIGITGSVGKTGSKEMLAHILAHQGGGYASQASFNNHVGVPLTLAGLPATAPYAVQEMGMSAPGEIAELTLMAGPDIALITRIANSHAGFFSSLAEIAVAKAEIFDGLCGLRVAVINRDDEFFDDLSRRAKLAGATRIISFGTNSEAEFCLLASTPTPDGQVVKADCAGLALTFSLGMAAPHWALNALGVLAVVEALGLDVRLAAATLKDFADLPGRGARHHGRFNSAQITLIDDSYNAGPASMDAALNGLHAGPPDILVLSDMLELGTSTQTAHTALAPAIATLAPRVVITLGPEMTQMASHLKIDHPAISCLAARDSDEALALLAGAIADNDVIFIKGSNGSGAHRVAAAVLAGLDPSAADTGSMPAGITPRAAREGDSNAA